MVDKAAAFLAERVQERTGDKEKMSVRLGAGEIALVAKWRRGGESVTAVVAKLLGVADESLEKLQQHGASGDARE